VSEKEGAGRVNGNEGTGRGEGNGKGRGREGAKPGLQAHALEDLRAARLICLFFPELVSM
jgi:hypothetical protein